MDIAQGTDTVAGGAAGGAAPRRRIDLQWLVIGLCVAVVLYLALIPLIFLLWQSFHTPQTASVPSVFTLENFRAAYSSRDTLRLFGNSLQFATGTALLAFVIGTVLAWMN